MRATIVSSAAPARTPVGALRRAALRGARAAVLFAGLLAQLALPGPAAAQTAQRALLLRVNVFPGASNLPVLLAWGRSLYARQELALELIDTPNSESQRAGLARGDFEIAQAAVDNAVAMIEVAGRDAVIVMGGDGSMNELVARPEIHAIADIRGKVLVVDAPNTAYALVARKILKVNGLLEGRDYRLDPVGGTPLRVDAMAAPGDHVAGMLNPPWLFIAESRGLHSLGRQSDLFGRYQSSGTFVMRRWAREHRMALVRFLAATIEGTRLARDPAVRAEAVTVLARRLKLTTETAERTWDALQVPGSGLAPDARFDLEGFRNVLALRAEIEGQWGGVPPSPERYLDFSYYDEALRCADDPARRPCP